MATTNQLICLSTFEYTSVVGPSAIIAVARCPSCGFRLDVRDDSLVNRYSSVLLLVGASAYVLYKLTDYSPKMKRISNKFWKTLGFDVNRLEPVFFNNKKNNPLVNFNESKLRTSGYFEYDDVPELDLPLPKTPISPFWQQLDINLNYNNYNLLTDRYLSENNLIRSPNMPKKNQTVDRIDEVLTQIDDIKKSFVEIDSQIFDFSGSKCLNFNPEFFTLTNTDLSEESDDIREDLKSGTDLNGVKQHYSIDDDMDQTPRTPLQELNLEWDLTDVESDCLFYDSDLFGVESALSLPVTDSDKQKIKTLQELLEEAKQLGLLNNILDAISCESMDNKSRDSAYFED